MEQNSITATAGSERGIGFYCYESRLLENGGNQDAALRLRNKTFSSNLEKRYKQLFKHPVLATAFDLLLEIPALWDDMRLSVMHRVIASRCDEVSPNIDLCVLTL